MKRVGKVRRLVKWTGIVLGVFVAYCIVHVLLVLFPHVWFSQEHTHKNFTVYMREEIPPEVTVVLDRVDALLSDSDLDDKSVHHEIYIFNSYRLSQYLFLRNIHFGCNMWTGDTFITDADVRQDIAQCSKLGPGDTRRRTLSEAITHEITHAQIRNHVGIGAERKVPSWIKEGYCEHIAEGCPVDYRSGISMLTSGTCAGVPGLHHLKFRLMMEYLLGEKHLTIDEILENPPDYYTVEREVLTGLRADANAFLSRIGSKIGLAQP